MLLSILLLLTAAVCFGWVLVRWARRLKARSQNPYRRHGLEDFYGGASFREAAVVVIGIAAMLASARLALPELQKIQQPASPPRSQ